MQDEMNCKVYGIWDRDEADWYESEEAPLATLAFFKESLAKVYADMLNEQNRCCEVRLLAGACAQ